MRITIKHIPYKPEHAKEILRYGANGFCINDEQQIDFFAKLKLKGEAYTAVCNDRIVACGGWEAVAEGVVQAWFLCVDDIDPMMVKDSKRKFLDMVKGFYRVQAPLREDFPLGEKFAKFIGFRFEKRIPQFYQDGTDALMYVLKGDI